MEEIQVACCVPLFPLFISIRDITPLYRSKVMRNHVFHVEKAEIMITGVSRVDFEMFSPICSQERVVSWYERNRIAPAYLVWLVNAIVTARCHKDGCESDSCAFLFLHLDVLSFCVGLILFHSSSLHCALRDFVFMCRTWYVLLSIVCSRPPRGAKHHRIERRKSMHR